MFKKAKLGLALGAGGARGLAHIGVLRAMERTGIRISFISGSSIGALIGGLYAHSPNTAELEKLIPEVLNSDFFRKAGLSRIREVFHDQPGGLSQRLETFVKKAYVQVLIATKSAILDTRTFQTMIEILVPDVNIEDLTLPFSAVSVDLRSGRPVLIKHGPLREAIYASISIPGVFSPLERDNLLLVDGGVLNMVPVLPLLSMGADLVYAVNVEMEGPFDEDPSKMKAIDILYRTEDIQSYALKELQLRLAHLVLTPKLGHIHWSDFSRATEMIQLGHDAVMENLDDIRSLARRRIFPLKWRKNFQTKLEFQWIEI